MDLNPARLRDGEWIVGASALVLLASMVFLDWYGLSSALAPTAERLGVSVSATGWDALTTLRWLLLLTIVLALALVYTQASRRAPAVPVSLSVIVTVLSIITALALIYRVLINEPGSDSVVTQQAGAFIGLLSALALVYGSYRSLRCEGTAAADAPQDIEVVRLQGSAG